jgi:hypothetical protein
MEIKFFIIGLTVLLGVSLFLLGCPPEASDDDSPGGNWYDPLGSGFSEVGNTVTVTGDVPLNKPLTIPAGKTLKIADDGTRTIGNGGSIAVEAGGTLMVDEGGTLTVTGTLAGTNGTSQLVLGAGVTSIVAGDSLTAGTYLWAAGAWLDETTVTANAGSTVTGLGGAGNVAVNLDDPTKVSLTVSEVEPAASFEVSEGITLAVPDGKALSVAHDVTFTVTGAIEVAVGGEITVESGGEYVLALGASGTNEGTITIESGGSTWSKGGNIAGEGVNVIEKGSKAYLGGATAAERVYMIGHENVTQVVNAVNPAPIILLTGAEAKLTFNDTTYRLDGDATLNGIWNQGTDNLFNLGESQTLTIGADSTLTIPDPTLSSLNMTVLRLRPASESSTPHVVGEANARIVLTTKGYIQFYDGETWIPSANLNSKTWYNFYNNNTTKRAANDLHNESYTWSATLGGGSDEGWLKQ